jgi:hypothetical protein
MTKPEIRNPKMKSQSPLLMPLPAAVKERRPVNRALPLPDWFIDGGRSYDYVTERSFDGIPLCRETLLTVCIPHEHDGRVMDGTFDDEAIEIEISDMHYSLGAKHYYGKVRLPEVRFRSGSGVEHMGYGVPDTRFLHVVEMTQELSQKEITSDPDRYRHWKRGGHYPGIDTPRAAFLKAQAWIKKFTRGFKVRVEADRDYQLS